MNDLDLEKIKNILALIQIYDIEYIQYVCTEKQIYIVTYSADIALCIYNIISNCDIDFNNISYDTSRNNLSIRIDF